MTRSLIRPWELLPDELRPMKPDPYQAVVVCWTCGYSQAKRSITTAEQARAIHRNDSGQHQVAVIPHVGPPKRDRSSRISTDLRQMTEDIRDLDILNYTDPLADQPTESGSFDGGHGEACRIPPGSSSRSRKDHRVKLKALYKVQRELQTHDWLSCPECESNRVVIRDDPQNGLLIQCLNGPCTASQSVPRPLLTLEDS